MRAEIFILRLHSKEVPESRARQAYLAQVQDEDQNASESAREIVLKVMPRCKDQGLSLSLDLVLSLVR